jgi:hypothetical protein
MLSVGELGIHGPLILGVRRVYERSGTHCRVHTAQQCTPPPRPVIANSARAGRLPLQEGLAGSGDLLEALVEDAPPALVFVGEH